MRGTLTHKERIVAHQTLEKIAKERQSLLALVADLSEEALDQKHGDGWTVRETLTHLVNAEEDHCRVIAVVARGESERLPTDFSLDEHNRQRLEERGTLALPALLAALAEQRQKTESLFDRLSAEQLDLPAHHPALGETTIGKIFRIIGIHEKMHAQEISAALANG